MSVGGQHSALAGFQDDVGGKTVFLQLPIVKIKGPDRAAQILLVAGVPLPYIDRVVHQWYVEEFIKPYILPKFISTSFACLPEKGTHKAATEVQNQMRRYKMQVRRFLDFKV